MQEKEGERLKTNKGSSNNYSGIKGINVDEDQT